ncbi:UNVERIFIED_CONTAM: hypothetical protein Sindi_0903000 [Sesamum indicum]
MKKKSWIVLVLIVLSTSKSEGDSGVSSAGLLCVSNCETCPVVCSPPPSTPQSTPPPSAAHHSPPQPVHPAPPPPSDGGAVPPPPELYVYSPGTTVPPGMLQQNFSYPYYYFYTSKATCSLPDLHPGIVPFLMFVFFQVLYSCR